MLLGRDMSDKSIHELLTELEASLRGGQAISEQDRELLGKVHAEVSAAVRAKPGHSVPSVKPGVQTAIDQLSAKYPHLSSLLSRTLDALSDLGV